MSTDRDRNRPDGWYSPGYAPGDWYSPLNPPAETSASRAEVPPKSKKRKARTAGIIIIAAVIAVCAFLGCFSYTEISFSTTVKKPADEELPENFTDYFESYFTGVESTATVIGIPEAEREPDRRFGISGEKPAGGDLTLSGLYSLCSPSIVGIEGSDDEGPRSWGTGIVMSEDGYILTNTHVINECTSAKVILTDDSEYDALLIGADGISDIAVLKIDAQGLAPASFGDSSKLSVGEGVAAIGNPLGSDFRLTLTDGIVSAIDRGVSYNGHSMTLIQTNAALNEGNSGGALFNMRGEVVGITNMKMMSAFSSIEGIGFAIPCATVVTVVDSIMRYGEVRGRPSIGITVGAIPESIAKHYELPEGLYVTSVSEGSDPEKKGILPGDILLAVNGVSVATADEVNAIKNEHRVGDSLILTVWRDGEEKDYEILLMETNDIYK